MLENTLYPLSFLKEDSDELCEDTLDAFIELFHGYQCEDLQHSVVKFQIRTKEWHIDVILNMRNRVAFRRKLRSILLLWIQERRELL